MHLIYLAILYCDLGLHISYWSHFMSGDAPLVSHDIRARVCSYSRAPDYHASGVPRHADDGAASAACLSRRTVQPEPHTFLEHCPHLALLD